MAGKKISTGPISSLPKARAIAAELKRWIVQERFAITKPVQLLPQPGTQSNKPLEIRTEEAI